MSRVVHIDMPSPRTRVEAHAQDLRPRPLAEQPTPASLAQVDVTLANASGASKASGEGGASPFNQLSPLHLSDFLTAL